MCCWRGTEEINWLDRVKYDVVIHTVKDTNNLHAVKRRKTTWIGHILRRYRLLKHVIEGIIYTRKEVTGRRGKSLKQLLGDLKGTTEYWKLEEKALDRTLWKTRLGRGFGPVVRLWNEWTCFKLRFKILKAVILKNINSRYMTQYHLISRWTSCQTIHHVPCNSYGLQFVIIHTHEPKQISV
jgi:hypothetical protein